ncbi:MAG: hypothetical protein J6S45_00190, partial [Firmicutes bacterium]|nr:hypothetical protein [Bacillota bacterium]
SRENAAITRSNIAYCLVGCGKKKEALEELQFCQRNGYNVENLSSRIKALDEELNNSSTKEKAKTYYNSGNYAMAYSLLRPLMSFGSSGELLYVSTDGAGELLFQFAYAAADCGHDKEAQAAYSRYISLNPGDAVAYNNRANIYHKWGWDKSELTDLEKAWSLGERRWNLESRLADCRKKIAEQDAKAKEQAKFNGDMTYLQQCFEQKKYELVCKTGDTWRAKGWDLGSYDFKYAYALVEQGRDSDALAAYGRYIQKYPKDTAPLNNRANILERKERYKEALADLEKAYALGQRDFNIDARMDRLKKKIEEADVELQRKKRFEADKSAVQTDYEAKNYEAVVARLRSWYMENYDMGMTLFKYAYSLSEVGRKEEALLAYNRYLLKYTDSTAAYNNRANLWEAKGELDKALADLEKAYALGQRDFNIEARIQNLKNKKEAKLQAERREQRWQEDCRRMEHAMETDANPSGLIHHILSGWIDEGQDIGKYAAWYAWALGLKGEVGLAEGRFEWIIQCDEFAKEAFCFRGRMYAFLWDAEKDELYLDKALEDLGQIEEFVFEVEVERQLYERLKKEKAELVEERRRAEEEERKRREEEEFLLLMM